MTENPNQDPADVIAGHLPDVSVPPYQDHSKDPRNVNQDPTYGGGFRLPSGGPVLARPNEPATRAQVNGLEGRVAELERLVHHVDVDLENLERDTDEPCDVPGGRQARALAMLGTADTIRATGGAAEIGGIRMERCDTYGRTETTERLERVRMRLGILEREASQLKDERDAALAGAESAERDTDTVAATLACGATTVNEGVWRDCARTVGHPGPHVATPLERVEW